ncbi:MAG: selenocysteine-specific translation elongation factor [Deltaproteobacteria bacterium]|nr:selenocysteine-specific translation elongation factor [Deltaproteobacteria bacterium]
MAKHVTIGIAGHVDHGKTSLVKALTGVDTDRLEEEKRRGLSIDSGIAAMDTSRGACVSLVDVPGHVHFLKNTVRGLCAVDAAVLVVAADDGVMPQTVEHLEVLRFFGARIGLVVLTKTDLVDEETLELAELEVQDTLEMRLGEHPPVLPFSARDNRGLEAVRDEIENLAAALPPRDTQAPFRCWIDRVKGFPGFGTVVSGTVLSGAIAENDPVHLLPMGIESRARSLESHHTKQTRLEAGQRAGINLPKIAVRQIRRGMLLAEPGVLEPGYLLNVEIRMLQNARRPIRNRQRVKLYLGTSVTNTMVVLMDREVLAQGEQGLAQLRLMKPLAALPRDTFVMALLNEQVIIGGGRVLEVPKEKFRPKKASRVLPLLEALRAGTIDSYLDRFFLKGVIDRPVCARDIQLKTGLQIGDIEKELESRLHAGELLSFGKRGVFPKARFEVLRDQTLKTVEILFAEDPLKKTAVPDEIRARLNPLLDDLPFRRILTELCGTGKLARQDGGFRIPNLSLRLSEERQELISMLMDYAQQSGLIPVGAGSFCKLHDGKYNKNEVQRLLDHLHAEKRLVRLNNMRFMTPQAMEEIKRRVRSHIKKNGKLGIADCADVFGYGRNVGIPVLDYLDAVGFTLWDGKCRTLKQPS